MKELEEFLRVGISGTFNSGYY